jgi:hypothetical protein
VLHLEHGVDEDDRTRVGLSLSVRCEAATSTPASPPALVSEAAREVLGALKAGTAVTAPIVAPC